MVSFNCDGHHLSDLVYLLLIVYESLKILSDISVDGLTSTIT